MKLGESIPECCEEIVEIIKNTPLFDRLREVFIDTFVKSKDFDTANDNSDSLESYEPFTTDQINRIVKGFLVNFEISHGFRSARVVRRLFTKYKEVIDPDLKTKFNEFKR